nr:hypothetical protein [Tanacetum cinerariifolium]
MTEALQEADRLCDSYQRENDEFLQTIDDNKKRIIKEHVKSQVKEQVSRILPRIEESVNAQLEAEMEGNKSIQRSDEQRKLYKALVDAYEADKTILDSYGETAILKRRREDDDDQEGPSAGSDQGSKRRREGEEPESARALLEPATRSAASASESAFAKDPYRLPLRLKNPHIRCLKQVQKINILFKLLSILNGSFSRRNLQLWIVIGTRPCQLPKETDLAK